MKGRNLWIYRRSLVAVNDVYTADNYALFKCRDESRTNLRYIEQKLANEKNKKSLELLLEQKEKAETALIDIRNQIININFNLVRKIAYRMSCLNSGEMDIYISDGSIGLIRAVEKYDLSHEKEFSTYASYWIYASITRSYHESGNLIKVGRKMNKFRKKLSSHFSAKEYYKTAKKVGLTENQAKELMPFVSEPLSLETTTNNNNQKATPLKENIVKEDSLTQEELVFLKEKKIFLGGIREWIDRSELSPIQNEVINEVYGILSPADSSEVNNLDCIAKKIYSKGFTDHVFSRQRIQQIKKAALKKMRDNSPIAAVDFL